MEQDNTDFPPDRGGRLIDITGRTFGSLVAKRRVPTGLAESAWMCLCSCGNELKVKSRQLRRGLVTSCGCETSARPGMACATPTRKHPDGRTGTTNGWFAHYYLYEAPCDACLEGHRTAAIQKRIDDPLRALKTNLWTKYRLRLDDYFALLESQGGRCAICRVEAPRDPRTNRFHVDHDHQCCPGSGRSCGQCVRGLLCHSCNTALGNFGDDVDRLHAAVRYLNRKATVMAV
jgi:recombination endonuclease VII